ncbi:glycosyltransferase family 39 protein [Patescibacteria group bacterium]|nr:glycosyltransferase family 39 protein [Patescibacteria group bacterium]
MFKYLHNYRYLLSILFLALILRLVVINQSFWLDEAIGALVVKEQNIVQIATQFPKGDNHPPLYYLALEGWGNLFGYSEVALRGLSVLFGVLTVYFTFLIAKIFTNKKKVSYPLFSALLLASSPFHIYYSQEARMYIMAGLFASMAIYYFLLTLDTKVKQKYPWILFSLSITALVFIDYVPVFLLPLFWLFAFIKKQKKDWWIKFLLSHLPLVFSGALWLPIFLVQLERGAWLMQKLPAWSRLAGGATPKQALLVWAKFILGRISFKNKVLYYSLIGISSLPFIYSLSKALKERKKICIIWSWLLVPLSLTFIASLVFPAFIYFRFLYVVPAFYLLVAWGVNQIKDREKRVLIGGLLLAVNIVGWLFYVGEPYQQREQWRQAVSFIESRAQKDKDVVVFENPQPFAPYMWYEKGEIDAFGATNSILADEAETKQKTLSIINNRQGVYYFEYLHDLSDPKGIVVQTIQDVGFGKDEIFDFIGVGQVTYWTK